MNDPVTFSADELTFEFTPAQARAVRAYVERREQELLVKLADQARRGHFDAVTVRGEMRALSEFDQQQDGGVSR